jgi:hypothetical protein
MAPIKKPEWARIMQHRIDKILDALYGKDDRLFPPIELDGLRDNFRVIAVEERQMIPEASIEPAVGGFRVYIRSNFPESGSAARRRFTLAHEFCHTLFYDWTTDVPRRIQGAPKGEAVEELCHRGAGLLLVPTKVLLKELQGFGGIVAAKHVALLASKFRTSIEVILRRLQEATEPPIDRAIILAGPLAEGSELRIIGSYTGPWIIPHLGAPKYGTSLAQWCRATDEMGSFARGESQREVQGGQLTIGPAVPVGGGRILLDLNMEPTDIGQAPL